MEHGDDGQGRPQTVLIGNEGHDDAQNHRRHIHCRQQRLLAGYRFLDIRHIQHRHGSDNAAAGQRIEPGIRQQRKSKIRPVRKHPAHHDIRNYDNNYHQHQNMGGNALKEKFVEQHRNADGTQRNGHQNNGVADYRQIIRNIIPHLKQALAYAR